MIIISLTRYIIKQKVFERIVKNQKINKLVARGNNKKDVRRILSVIDLLRVDIWMVFKKIVDNLFLTLIEILINWRVYLSGERINEEISLISKEEGDVYLHFSDKRITESYIDYMKILKPSVWAANEVNFLVTRVVSVDYVAEREEGI